MPPEDQFLLRAQGFGDRVGAGKQHNDHNARKSRGKTAACERLAYGAFDRTVQNLVIPT